MRTIHFAGAKVTVDIERKAYKDRWGDIENWCMVSVDSVENSALSAYLTGFLKASYTRLASLKILATTRAWELPHQGWWAPDSETNNSQQLSFLHSTFSPSPWSIEHQFLLSALVYSPCVVQTVCSVIGD